MSVTLNSLTRRVRSTLEAEPEAVALFRDRLLSAGYVEDPYYDAFWFTPSDRSTYRWEWIFEAHGRQRSCWSGRRDLSDISR